MTLTKKQIQKKIANKKYFAKLKKDATRYGKALEKKKEWYKNLKNNAKKYNKFKKKLRANALKYKYGLTQLEYDLLLQAQNNCCAICGEKFTKKNKPCVDHDHNSGKVREITCNGCNVATGMLKENVSTVLKLAAYLIRHKNT